MKRALIIAILAALPAAAQWRHFGREQARATGFFGLGFSAPTNPLASSVDTGFSFTGGVGVTGNYVGILIDGMFSQFGINHANLAGVGATEGNQKYWAVTVDPIFHVNQRGPVDFYVTGGGGIYGQVTQFNTPVFSINNGQFPGNGQFSGGYQLVSTNTIYKPGVNGGAGFAFNLGYGSHVKLFTEARFHHMFTHGSGASFIPVTLGVRF